jgi:hypothetical protein
MGTRSGRRSFDPVNTLRDDRGILEALLSDVRFLLSLTSFVSYSAAALPFFSLSRAASCLRIRSPSRDRYN